MTLELIERLSAVRARLPSCAMMEREWESTRCSIILSAICSIKFFLVRSKSYDIFILSPLRHRNCVFGYLLLSGRRLLLKSHQKVIVVFSRIISLCSPVENLTITFPRFEGTVRKSFWKKNPFDIYKHEILLFNLQLLLYTNGEGSTWHLNCVGALNIFAFHHK